jgi:hypothetical protein
MQDEILFTRDATARRWYQKTITQNMIWHNGLRMFNALPASVKQGRNLDEFKCQIFETLREQFPVQEKNIEMLQIMVKNRNLHRKKKLLE